MSKTFAIVSCNLAGWHVYKRAFETETGIPTNSETVATFRGTHLVPEPNNAVDPNAILFMNDGRKLGYVPASIAPLVKSLLDNGYSLTPRCVSVSVSRRDVFFELLLPSLKV